MAGIESLVSVDELKTNRLVGHGRTTFSVRYQTGFDALFILIVEPKHDTVVHYIDDHVGLIYEDETLEIVGIQVEAFERSFLSKHEGLRKIWKLSEAGTKIRNFGDLALTFETFKPKLVQEVIRITQDQLGPRGDDIAAAIA